ncbi:ras GTPase-activating protein nGAP isoform X2, partial [Scomber scombrus]
MSGSKTPPEGGEGPVQGPCHASHRWHRYRKPWRRDTAPEQPLDRYKWRTSAHLAPEGKGHGTEPPHQRMLSLPRLSGTATPRTGSLRRVLPFLRSMSEPGTTGEQGGAAASQAERRVGSVSSFISSLHRRMSRILRDEPESAAS